jgi:hypothetical protein
VGNNSGHILKRIDAVFNDTEYDIAGECEGTCDPQESASVPSEKPEMLGYRYYYNTPRKLLRKYIE